jgi:hypothetical protein
VPGGQLAWRQWVKSVVCTRDVPAHVTPPDPAVSTRCSTACPLRTSNADGRARPRGSRPFCFAHKDLLDQQLTTLESEFLEQGGLREHRPFGRRSGIVGEPFESFGCNFFRMLTRSPVNRCPSGDLPRFFPRESHPRIPFINEATAETCFARPRRSRRNLNHQYPPQHEFYEPIPKRRRQTQVSVCVKTSSTALSLRTSCAELARNQS